MTDVTGHTITLTYVTASCYSVPVMSEYYTVGTPPDNDYIKRNFTAGISQTCYLSKIETDTEEVIFEMEVVKTAIRNYRKTDKHENKE